MLANDLDRLTPAQQDALIGAGAPLQMRQELVRGIPMRVFAHRPHHLPELLLDAAQRFPDRHYLIDADRRLTYPQVAEQVAKLAALLRDDYGVGPGDRVAVVGRNTLEHALTIWAVAWLGAATVALHGWWTGDELRHGLDLTDPRLLVGDQRPLDRLNTSRDPGVPSSTFAQLFSKLDTATATAPVARGLDEDTLIAILFTSGTTGRPKGAMITHRGLANMATDSRLRAAIDLLESGASPASDPPVLLLTSPLFHISGLGPVLSSAPTSGNTLVFAPAEKWDAAVHLELSQRHRVTNWSIVPTQAIRMLRHPELSGYDLKSLRGIAFGGAPMSTELIGLLATELPWVRPSMGFGMTESTGLGTTISGERLIANTQSIGFANPSADVILRDADGTQIGTEGAIGEICVRCPGQFLGYWGNEAATATALDTEGWYRTGDFGSIRDGMLRIESRLRDMIIRGGENVYPIEIENRLSEHPDLVDAAVIGAPHDELGQQVVAVVVVRAGAAVTTTDIQQWVARTLAAFKVPDHVRFADSLPYSETGKLLKRELERE